MEPEEFVKKSREGGFSAKHNVNEWGGEIVDSCLILETIIDPRAWRAVGKVEGWDDLVSMRITGRPEMTAWQYNMHRMIDALGEASNQPNFNVQEAIRDYLKTL